MNDELLGQHREDEANLVPQDINLALLELDEVRLRSEPIGEKSRRWRGARRQRRRSRSLSTATGRRPRRRSNAVVASTACRRSMRTPSARGRHRRVRGTPCARLALRVGLQANFVERLANVERRTVALNRHAAAVEEVHVRRRHRRLELELLQEPARRLLGLVELRAAQGRDRE